MTAATTIELRPLLRTDLAAAHALSVAFQWPHRADDWAFMCDLGQGVVATCGKEIVGTAMWWTYGKDRAALGMVGVTPLLHGRGIGRRLTKYALDGLGDRSVLLHATEAGLHLYETLGFEPTGRIRQHHGAAFQAGLMPLRDGERLRPTGRSDPALLAGLDRKACGMDRRELMAAVLKAAEGVVLDRDGDVAGFALMRRFGIGQVIGPVVAPDEAAARALIGHFLSSNQGQFIRIDVPEESGLSPWLQQLGLSDAGPAIRMVRGPSRPPDGTVRSFALVSQAFG